MLDQLAVLDGPGHRPEVVPDNRVPEVSATGVPDHFDSWSSYENYVQLLVELHCIDDAKKIWWDVRPHPTFGTLEFRVCDVTTKPEAAVMIAALPGDHRQAAQAVHPQSGLPPLPAR